MKAQTIRAKSYCAAQKEAANTAVQRLEATTALVVEVLLVHKDTNCLQQSRTGKNIGFTFAAPLFLKSIIPKYQFFLLNQPMSP